MRVPTTISGQQDDSPEESDYIRYEGFKSIGDWLDYCGVNLDKNGMSWPLEELNKLLDLRTQPKKIYDQCISWEIFRDNRAADLPPFEGRARDPTTFEVERSACAKPPEAVETVLTCYEEGPRDPDPRIRTIYIDRIIRDISAERASMCQTFKEFYVNSVIGVLREGRESGGLCGLCQHYGLSTPSKGDFWGQCSRGQ